MGICECIVISLCVIVVGLWGLLYLAHRFNFLEEEMNNAKKVYKDNVKKPMMKTDSSLRMGEETKKKASKAGSERNVRTKNDSLRMPELPKETKKTPAKRGRKPSVKGGHLD